MRTRILTLMATAALALTAAACGRAAPSADGVASLGSKTTTEEAATGDSSDDGEVDRQQAMLDFAKCMREHGIDIPDPQFGDGGRVTIGLGGGPGGEDGPSTDGPAFDPDDAKFQEAQEACGGPGGGFATSRSEATP